jgi:hypothetical protein
VLKPFTELLVSSGYGYSAVEIIDDDRDAVIDMLRDWGWTGEALDIPNWLLRDDRPDPTSPT